MEARTIDHSTLSRLVRDGAVTHAQAIGRTGGWVVVVHREPEHAAYTLAAQRSKGTRYFKKMDSVVNYLKTVGISRFEVDAETFDASAVQTYSRPDRASALKRTHEAAAHDLWFREQVDIGLREADAPDAVWLSDDEAKADANALRTQLQALAAGRKA